ncbi:MAG: hypothetical protein SFV15_16315 [Polyangiaceae bacterium]|nr:hypothetical protein [Polyangiaceae bacterium]
MDLEAFKRSLKGPPPKDLDRRLLALWHEAHGDWEAAHEIAQSLPDAEGAWVHAYLHRREGDNSNAGYWYAHAGKSFCRTSLEAEWEKLVRIYLGDG